MLDHKKPVSARQAAHRANYGQMQKAKFALSREVRAGRAPIAPLYIDVWKVKPVIAGDLMDCVVVFNDQRRRSVRWDAKKGILAFKGDGPLDAEARASLAAADALLTDCWLHDGQPTKRRKADVGAFDAPLVRSQEPGEYRPAKPAAPKGPTPWRRVLTAVPILNDTGDLVTAVERLRADGRGERLNVTWDGFLCLAIVDGVAEEIDDELRADLEDVRDKLTHP